MRRGWEAEARNWAEFTRTQAYSQALEAAGLLVEAIREPRPSDELVTGLAERRWQRIPLSLQPRAVKP